MKQETGTVAYQGSLVLMVYLYAAASMAVVGLVVPFIGIIAAQQHVSPGMVGAGLSFFSVPAAFTSFLFGMVVDRMGVKKSFLISILLTVVGDLLLQSSHVWLFRAALMLCGCGFAFATSSPPVLFLKFLDKNLQSRALAFWSTFATAGYSAGLLLAIPFLKDANWHRACLTHLTLMLVILIGGMLLMRPLHEARAVHAQEKQTSRAARPSLRLIVALGLTVAFPNAIAYGTSLIAPAYLARTYHVSLAASSTEVALIKIGVMLVGGFIISLCTGTERRSRLMFFVMACLGIAAQTALLTPTSIAVASTGLFVWTFAYSGLSGAGMSLLPLAAGDPRNRGIVAGTIGQFISVSSVLVPYIYFSTSRWTSYELFAATGLTCGCLAIMLVRRQHGDQPADTTPEGAQA